MKIVQIFPGKVWGGAEQYVLDLGRALQQRGHRVSFLCRNVEAVTLRLKSENIGFEIYRPGDSTQLADADIVHIHDGSFVGSVDRDLRGCEFRPRVILTRHIARSSRVMPWRRSAYRRLDAIIFVSQISERLWRSVNRWMPAEKCTVVHNSIPPEAVDKSVPSVRQRFGIPDSVPLLMMTGRIRKSKGCEVIIDALSRIDGDYAMVFVGAPKPSGYADKLRGRAASLGIVDRIHFYGFTPDARSLVSQSDIGLQPSIVREAFGLSQLEFMQAGKPLITSDNGAQPEYVRSGETGFLVPPDDAEALAAVLRPLIFDPQLRDKIGSAAADYYKRHLSYNSFVDRIIKVYNHQS